jgi:glutathione S-transferase
LGSGPAHNDASLRLFGAQEKDVRVTLYRDMAAWCPYCQKVWLHLEEKQIPYRVVKVPMRSYGDKPSSFLRKVPSGLLPALELDGKLHTESLDIMKLMESTFPTVLFFANTFTLLVEEGGHSGVHLHNWHSYFIWYY